MRLRSSIYAIQGKPQQRKSFIDSRKKPEILLIYDFFRLTFLKLHSSCLSLRFVEKLYFRKKLISREPTSHTQAHNLRLHLSPIFRGGIYESFQLETLISL
jgi:hypothetical protein